MTTNNEDLCREAFEKEYIEAGIEFLLKRSLVDSESYEDVEVSWKYSGFKKGWSDRQALDVRLCKEHSNDYSIESFKDACGNCAKLIEETK